MSAQDDKGNYIVVARRYRPQAFDELIGQSHVAQALTNAIKTNRVGHAYLFTGARGVGKTSAARILAKALNCSHPLQPGVPCQTCNICNDIAAGEDVDVLEIDGASNRGIDEIRQLRSNVNIRPSRAGYKVYIIDEVHMLTMQAFNALLKTLEEPPEHVKFVFCTTDPEKIPITVLSRCQRFDFASVDSASIKGRLEHICREEKVKADDDALTLLARRAAGSMRDSQSLLEQLLSFCGDELKVKDVQQLLGTADTGRVLQLARAITDHRTGDALADVDAAINGGVDAGQLTEQLLICWRDIAALKVGCGDELLQFARPDDVPLLHEIGEQTGLETVLEIMQVLDSTLTKMRLSTHVRTLLEIAIVRASSLESVESLTAALAGMDPGKSASPASASAPVKKKAEPLTAGKDSAVKTEPVRPQSVAAEIGSEASGSVASGSEASGSGNSDRKPSSQDESASGSGDHSDEKNVALPTASSSKNSVSSPPAGENPVTSPTESPRVATTLGLPHTELTRKNVSAIWSQVLEEIGDMSAEFARAYKSLAISAPNQLVVTLSSAYNKDECERANRKPRFEQVLSKIAGQPMRIDFRVDQQQATKPKSPKKTRNQLMREAQKHPLVADAIATFDGEIVEVQMPRDDS